MRFLNQITGFLQQVLPIGFGILFLMSVWSYFSNEEYNDDQITFTVSCNSVLRNADQYPLWIIDECRRVKGL